ncbi:MAG: hypothetical protein JW874_15805 [Spirochaetales bacterium]|nr:hypothetical protein [Spirochaetales bacterium]
MTKRVIFAILWILMALSLPAEQPFRDIDLLMDNQKWQEAKQLLVSPGLSRVGVLLRQALIGLQESNQNYDWEKAGKEQRKQIKEEFFNALAIIDQAFALENAMDDPEAHKLFYARAFGKSMIGSIDQNMSFLKEIKFIMDDLEQAINRQKDYIEAIVFAGRMYQYLPGWPISQGDKQKAISFIRYAKTIVDDPANGFSEKKQKDWDANVKFALCELLVDRGWSARKRAQKQEQKEEKAAGAVTFFEQLGYYEAEVSLQEISDIEEARQLYVTVKKYFLSDTVQAELTETQKNQFQATLEKLEKKMN